MRAKLKLDGGTVHPLRALKARTGLTPNILCRAAFALSLEEPSAPDPRSYDEAGTEFNRYTLTGEYDDLFVAYLKEWLRLRELDGEDPDLWFRAHINRGVGLLMSRLRDIADISTLIPSRT